MAFLGDIEGQETPISLNPEHTPRGVLRDLVVATNLFKRRFLLPGEAPPRSVFVWHPDRESLLDLGRAMQDPSVRSRYQIQLTNEVPEQPPRGRSWLISAVQGPRDSPQMYIRVRDRPDS